MADFGRELTPKQRAFALALLNEKDTRAAAKRAGVAERTAYRWAGDPGIQHAIAEAENAALQQAVRGLIRLAPDAVGTLGRALSDDATPPVAIRAADLILARLLQLRELLDYDRRLAALEEAERERASHETRR